MVENKTDRETDYGCTEIYSECDDRATETGSERVTKAGRAGMEGAVNGEEDYKNGRKNIVRFAVEKRKEGDRDRPDPLRWLTHFIVTGIRGRGKRT